MKKVRVETPGDTELLPGQLVDKVVLERANDAAKKAKKELATFEPLILGIKVPPNYGPAYTRTFDALFEDVAKARRAPVVPYLFEGFGEDVTQFQPDRVHPIAAVQPRILDNVWPSLVPLLARK